MNRMSDDLHDFSEHVKSVFSWSPLSMRPDSNLMKLFPDAGIPEIRTIFYDRVYLQRENETDAFRSFLKSDDTILIVSGHVGIGKSSFLLCEIEHVGSCTGIIVNVEQAADTFRSNDFHIALRKTISKAIETRLISLIENGFLDSKIDISSMSFTRDGNALSGKDRVIAKLCLASFILTHNRQISSESIESIRAKFDKDVEFSDDATRFNRYYENLNTEERLTNCLNVSAAMNTADWIRLYQVIIKPDKPIVIILDNTDAARIEGMQENLYEEMVRLHGEMNLPRPGVTDADPIYPSIRFVYAVRDENAALVRAPAFPANSARRIAFTLDHYPVPEIEHVTDASEIQTTKTFLSRLVKRRLRILLDNPTVDQILLEVFIKIFDLWFSPDVSSGELNVVISRFDLAKLGNHSIRWILDHIASVCLEILQICVLSDVRNEVIARRNAAPWMRGLIVRLLFKQPCMTSFAGEMRRAFAYKRTSPYLFYPRLLLSYLSNLSDRGPDVFTTPQGLYNMLLRLCSNASLKRVKEMLFALYVSEHAYEEMIAIRQKGEILSSDDIDDDSKIFIMPRGSELVNSILINIDVFGEMIPDTINLPMRRNRRKVLDEMLPREAAVYLSTIFFHSVLPMTTSFETFVRQHIGPNLAKYYTSNPEATLLSLMAREDVLVGNRFYLTRFCDSHMNAIRRYIGLVMQGEQTALLISANGRKVVQTIASEIEKKGSFIRSGSHPSRDMLTEVENRVDPASDIGKIFSILTEYKRVQDRFSIIGATAISKFNANQLER